MPFPTRLTVPVQGNWFAHLDIVESTDDGNTFVYIICVRMCSSPWEVGTLRTSKTASNIYPIIKSTHLDTYLSLKLNQEKRTRKGILSLLHLSTICCLVGVKNCSIHNCSCSLNNHMSQKQLMKVLNFFHFPI